jgi:hypothetical protein
MTMQIRALGINRPDPMPAAMADRRAPMRDLAQALKAGDVAKASEAYATLASKAPERAARNPDGPFARIGTALAAGDLAAARAAFAEVFTSHLPGRTGDGPAPAAPDRATTAIAGGPGGLLDVSA